MINHSISLLFILSFFTSCASKDKTSNDSGKKDSSIVAPQKINFTLDSVNFTKKIIDTNRKFNLIFSNIPNQFEKIADDGELKFEINFNKDYFNFTNEIKPSSLRDDSFYHTIIEKYYNEIIGIDLDSDLNLKNKINNERFVFFTKNINNYGTCNIGIIYSGTCNADQDKTMILINNKKQELSIWNYDEFKFDKQGNIFALFRLKDRRTWYYFNYDTVSNCFIPVATKYWKLYEN
jgi:hypothetical protein